VGLAVGVAVALELGGGAADVVVVAAGEVVVVLAGLPHPLRTSMPINRITPKINRIFFIINSSLKWLVLMRDN
jgi:hypothetical protein